MHPFVPSLAQPVLDLFPDVVSQFGLLGCGASLVILAVPLALCAHAVWSAFKPAPRRAEWRYDRVSARDIGVRYSSRPMRSTPDNHFGDWRH